MEETSGDASTCDPTSAAKHRTHAYWGGTTQPTALSTGTVGQATSNADIKTNMGTFQQLSKGPKC
jgi:hypothetical protein